MRFAEQRSDLNLSRVTPRDLRHTTASLSVSAGANVKDLQRMLGHASAAVTLDIYSYLSDHDLYKVAIALDRARTESLRESFQHQPDKQQGSSPSEATPPRGCMRRSSSTSARAGRTHTHWFAAEYGDDDQFSLRGPGAAT
ncbi:tyrosine-type recombinase/integrase [Microbacterium sp.]|uniref:tyrosine-type recombinase/integrase n=1 Tax=Microbacterium sp. TaxID=51671 RepID=UPI003A921557